MGATKLSLQGENPPLEIFLEELLTALGYKGRSRSSQENFGTSPVFKRFYTMKCEPHRKILECRWLRVSYAPLTNLLRPQPISDGIP